MTQHRDTTKGLYARLADATDHALLNIKRINDAIGSDAHRPDRLGLEKALETVRDIAWDQYRFNYTNVVSAEAFTEVSNWFKWSGFITSAWERTGENIVDWKITLEYTSHDGVGSVELVLIADCTAGGVLDRIVEVFDVLPSDGESLHQAVGKAHAKAITFLRGIKRVHLTF